MGCRSHGRSSPLKTERKMEQVSYASSNQPVTRSFSLPTAHSPKMRTSLSSSQRNSKLLLRAQTPLSLTTKRLLLAGSNVKIVHMPVAKAIISLVPDVEGFVLPGEAGSLVGASHCAGASTVVGCPLFFASCLSIRCSVHQMWSSLLVRVINFVHPSRVPFHINYQQVSLSQRI